jgi:hypothetical protein
VGFGAIDAVLADRPVNPDQKPSIGCNIKWKPGNEPAYYTSASRRRGIWQWLSEQLKPRFKFGGKPGNP